MRINHVTINQPKSTIQYWDSRPTIQNNQSLCLLNCSGGCGSTDKVSLPLNISTHTLKYVFVKPHLHLLFSEHYSQDCSYNLNILLNFLYLLFSLLLLIFILSVISLATRDINLIFLIRTGSRVLLVHRLTYKWGFIFFLS